jgi:hypothetical protein
MGETREHELNKAIVVLHDMTMLLEKAFSEAQKLEARDQDVLASIIMEEMLAERNWDEAFARTQNQLETLADEALTETKSGKAKPLRFN